VGTLARANCDVAAHLMAWDDGVREPQRWRRGCLSSRSRPTSVRHLPIRRGSTRWSRVLCRPSRSAWASCRPPRWGSLAWGALAARDGACPRGRLMVVDATTS